MNYTFFGTDEFSIGVITELVKANHVPSLIVTVPDRPAGRGQKMQMPPIKKWALDKNIPVVQPNNLDSDFINEIKPYSNELFIVASYGKIIPKNILDIPAKGSLNVHPSMLPKYRGPSPIESTILDDCKNTGVTIMLMDEKMDHGPILKQKEIIFDDWQSKNIIEQELAKSGGILLSSLISPWLSNEIMAVEQNHSQKTVTQKISKADGLIDFALIQKIIELEISEKNEDSDLDTKDLRQLFLKIIALNPWPSVYFDMDKNEKKIRIKILEADWTDNKIKITKLRPEGKNTISWQSFLDGYINNI